MPKLFVCSDLHSFYTPFKKALDEAGFDPTNKDHWLVVCGDVFDRGNESVEILRFLMSLERKVLVKGNHDILLEELCMREFPYSHDKHNGTLKTVTSFGNFDGWNFDECCQQTWHRIAKYRELLVNYFETQNYIFVHSWIPTHKIEKRHPADKWVTLTKDEYMEDWRNANEVEWEDAMWGNPFKKWQEGLNKTSKTIVFGHWHCSTGHMMASGGELTEFGDDACWKPFIHDNIIGIDRCTAHTGEVNVLVIEDEFL
jgi:serine/threonine protein phosphatase 1